MAELQLKDITMAYGRKKPVLEKLSLTVQDGSLVSILGPSGCGKTTTLRIIAGLLQQTSGQVVVDSQDISKVPVHKRQFGMVFQSYALFPHLTIFENVAFGLKQQHLPQAKIQEKVSHILQTTGLSQLAQRFPAQLSGGQQQRVSLARALVTQPKLLLMDEPLSNLDAKLRVEMREEIRRLQQKLHMTVIFVTHDQEECFAISDQVAVMNQGRVEQFATPQTIYHQPATQFVARFVGYENFLKVDAAVDADHVQVGQQRLKVNAPAAGAQFLTIRPEQVALTLETGENVVSGKLAAITYLGDCYRYTVQTAIGAIKVLAHCTQPAAIGTELKLRLPADQLLKLQH